MESYHNPIAQKIRSKKERIIAHREKYGNYSIRIVCRKCGKKYYAKDGHVCH